MDYIIVLAKVEPKEGCQDSIIEVANDLIYESLLEEGNIDYQLLKPNEGNSLTFNVNLQHPCCGAHQPIP